MVSHNSLNATVQYSDYEKDFPSHIIASINIGDTVLDLGCGAGHNCLLLRELVGESGKVIGLDMSPEMVQRSYENSYRLGFNNMEFRFGSPENMPIPDNSIDVVHIQLSNIENFSLEKVSNEVSRVLRPNGKIVLNNDCSQIDQEKYLSITKQTGKFVGTNG